MSTTTTMTRDRVGEQSPGLSAPFSFFSWSVGSFGFFRDFEPHTWQQRIFFLLLWRGHKKNSVRVSRVVVCKCLCWGDCAFPNQTTTKKATQNKTKQNKRKTLIAF